MNAPVESVFTVLLGEAEVRVPREAAVMAYLEQQIEQRRPLPVRFEEAAAGFDRVLDAPSIGTEWRGGIYAGITIANNMPHHLVLVSGELEEGTWKEATEWAAAKQGARALRPQRRLRVGPDLQLRQPVLRPHVLPLQGPSPPQSRHLAL